VHGHGMGLAKLIAVVVRRWRSRPVRRANARIILRPAPGQAHPRVANRISLHLVDRHFGRMPVHKLDEAATLPRRNLDISNVTESLEKRPQLVLRHVARQATHKHCSVVGVRELVHLRRRRKWRRRVGCRRIKVAHPPHLLAAADAATAATIHDRFVTRIAIVWRAALGRRRRDAHRPIATEHALHVYKGPLLISFTRETHKAVAATLARLIVRHNFGRFARGESSLEQVHQNELVDVGRQIANKDGVLWRTVVSAEPSARSHQPSSKKME